MASASPEIFDKDTFLQEILSETDPVRLLHIRKKYATRPYCPVESNSWLGYALKRSSTIFGYGYYCYSITNIIFDKLNESERTLVLEHIQDVCKDVPKTWHVLTDIDDTIQSSSTGGTNVKYKVHTVYPGVVSFYDKIIKTDTDFITLLSARPEVLAKGSRAEISKKTNKNVDMLTGQWFDMPGAVCDTIKRKCTSLTPSILHKVSEVINHYPKKITHISGSERTEWYDNYKKMGTTKFESILKYISIFPEFKFIFIGDSGQGDLICADKISRQGPTFPVKASFIHNILKAREISSHYDINYNGPIDSMLMIGESLRKKLKKRNIYLFNNYIDLAGYTSCLGLLNSEDLESVISETITDFNEDTFNEHTHKNEPSKKKQTYYDTPLFISYIENDLLRAQAEWSKEKICK
jgi:hypothetical protein